MVTLAAQSMKAKYFPLRKLIISSSALTFFVSLDLFYVRLFYECSRYHVNNSYLPHGRDMKRYFYQDFLIKRVARRLSLWKTRPVKWRMNLCRSDHRTQWRKLCCRWSHCNDDTVPPGDGRPELKSRGSRCGAINGHLFVTKAREIVCGLRNSSKITPSHWQMMMTILRP